MQSQFVVSQATIPEIASGMRLMIIINNNDIHRILIENTPNFFNKWKCII